MVFKGNSGEEKVNRQNILTEILEQEFSMLDKRNPFH